MEVDENDVQIQKTDGSRAGTLPYAGAAAGRRVGGGVFCNPPTRKQIRRSPFVAMSINMVQLPLLTQTEATGLLMLTHA